MRARPFPPVAASTCSTRSSTTTRAGSASCARPATSCSTSSTARKPVVSAIHGPAVGAGLVAGAAGRRLGRRGAPRSIIDGHTRLGVAAGRPRRDLLAVAVRHGQGQVLPAHLRDADRRGSRAHRPGLDLRRRRRGAADRDPGIADGLAGRAPRTPSAGPSSSLNNWYRMFAPTFETSLGLEFLGFGGPDVQEGLAAHREKRPARFTGGNAT